MWEKLADLGQTFYRAWEGIIWLYILPIFLAQLTPKSFLILFIISGMTLPLPEAHIL